MPLALRGRRRYAARLRMSADGSGPSSVPNARRSDFDSQGANGRPLTRGEQVNGHSLSRIASADNGVILAVAGDIDISSAAEFSDGQRALMEGAEGEVVLSLGELWLHRLDRYQGSDRVAQELRTRGQTLVLSGLNGQPRRASSSPASSIDGNSEMRIQRPDMTAE